MYFGKRTPAGLMSAINPAVMVGQLFFVTDFLSNTRFLIDSGSQVSIIAVNQLFANTHRQTKFSLLSVSGNIIPTYGATDLTVDLGINALCTWRFILAQVNHSIIGADFLRHYHLIIDMHNNRISQDTLPTHTMSLHAQLPHKISPSTFDILLQNFPNLTNEFLTSTPLKHQVTHAIETTASPVFAKARRLSPDKLIAAKTEFDNLIKLGFLRTSSSPWASPLHLVRKSDGSWRPCGDYRALNKITIPDRYPLPLLQDFTANCFGCNFFSKIDLVKAYHQIPIRPSDIQKSAIITPFGLFEYTRMSFGLKNAAQSFQRFMDNVFRGLPFCFVYLDDILIYSRNEIEHYHHLSKVFEKLSSFGIKINKNKCLLGKKQLEFLGHSINNSGVTPLKTKVNAIVNFPRPQTVKQLQRFLGMINFYHRFIVSCSAISAPLNKLIVTTKRNENLVWSATSITAFTEIKQALINCTMLSFHDPSAELSIMVDASNTAAGAVLQQKSKSGDFQPLYFFSKTFSSTEVKYSTFGRELLALYLSIKKFRPYIEGRTLTIFTDHKPLISAFNSCTDKFIGREYRHIMYVSEFTIDIRYIAGPKNVVADTLSRIETNNLQVTLRTLSSAQQEDSELKNILSNNTTSLRLTKIMVADNTTPLYVDTTSTYQRPFIPFSFREHIISSLHSLSHPGKKTTLRLVTSRYVWPNVRKDVAKFVQSCLQCQKSKITRHTVAPLSKFTEPTSRFHTIHVDIIGPLPVCNSYRYLLISIDRFSRWPEVHPLEEITATSVVTAFLTSWISRFGVPAIIITDRGRQFNSTIWSEFSKTFGIQHKMTTAYHPQCNGMVERFNRDIKTSLRATGEPNNWLDHLPLILLGLRSVIKPILGSTVAECLYGTTLRLPSDLVHPFSKFNFHYSSTKSDFIKNLAAKMRLISPGAVRFPKRPEFVPKLLKECTHVFIRIDAVKKPLQFQYEGPFPVIKRNTKFYTIQIRGKESTVSIDRLKPAFLPDESSVQVCKVDSQPTTILKHTVTTSTSSNPFALVSCSSSKHVHFSSPLCSYY